MRNPNPPYGGKTSRLWNWSPEFTFYLNTRRAKIY
jgi:hypothetical protein